MSIRKDELDLACRQASRNLVFDSGGWLDDITAVVTSLQVPAMANSPIATEKLAMLNTFIMVADSLLNLKKPGKGSKSSLPDGLNNPAKIFIAAIKLSLGHVKSRIENQLINIDQILASGRYYDKKVFVDAFRQSAKDMTSDQGNSFLSMVIVPGVLFAGEKRLNEIEGPAMALTYCQNLLSMSQMFNIYATTPDRPDSIETILKRTYKTMLQRIQDIHYVLNQTTGFEETVYVRPQLALIARCIKHFEKQICGPSAKEETIATRNYVSKRVKVLYLYAWNLQVTTADTLVIQVLQNGLEPNPSGHGLAMLDRTH